MAKHYVYVQGMKGSYERDGAYIAPGPILRLTPWRCDAHEFASKKEADAFIASHKWENSTRCKLGTVTAYACVVST